MGLPLSIPISRQLLYQCLQPAFYNFPGTRTFKYQRLYEVSSTVHRRNEINPPLPFARQHVCFIHVKKVFFAHTLSQPFYLLGKANLCFLLAFCIRQTLSLCINPARCTQRRRTSYLILRPKRCSKGVQVVNRVKWGLLKKQAKSFNIFNMMAMTLLILGFGVSSAFFLIGAQPFVEGTPLYAEYSANFDLLHPLFQVSGYGSFSHGLWVRHS